MMITIKNLHLSSIIGIYDHERTARQALNVTLHIEYDAGKAIASDNIADALDYDLIKNQILNLASDSGFYLIEYMAGQIMQILMGYEVITRATVEIDKPAAIKEADSVSFTLTQER